MSKNRKLILFCATVVAASAVVSAAALASGGSSSTHVATTAVSRGPLTARAAHFRTLAHRVIVARNKALGTRRVLAGAGPTTPTVTALRDVALEVAALNGEAAPTNGAIYASTRKAAERSLNGDTVDTDQPVYAITIHGHFVGYQAETLQSGDFPTGSVMTVVFDAQTLAVTDWGIMPAAPDVSALGAATSLGL